MNKDAEELEEGGLLEESFEFKEITWKVSNASFLPDLVNYEVQSQPFSFAGGSWKLAMYPNGQTKHKTEGYIDLNIERLNFRFSELSIFYKFSFKTADGNELNSFSGNVKLSTKYPVCYVIRYMMKSEFTDKKDIIVQNGFFTITCQMRTKKIAVIDKCSQIESSTSFLGEYI